MTTTTYTCAGSDILVASVNPRGDGWVDDLRRIRQTLGFVDCPECGALVDTRTEFCNLRVAEHHAPDLTAHCDFDDPIECSMAREREVAGVSDDVPPCPQHGAARF